MNESRQFTLRNGEDITIRRVVDDDTALLVDLYHHLSEETKLLRFHAIPPTVTEKQVWEQATVLSHLDSDRQVALVALVHADDGDHAIGVARFSRAAATDIAAEAAIVVRDDYQNAGLGKYLLRLLADVALSMGITQFEAWIRADNAKVLNILTNLNFPITWHTSRGETHVMVPLQID